MDMLRVLTLVVSLVLPSICHAAAGDDSTDDTWSMIGRGCTGSQILQRDAGNTAWTCAALSAGSEGNTYTSSKTFTSDVLLSGTGGLSASSATFTYGITAGTATFTSTATVQGNAFSVGGSSFTVFGGSATVAYRMTAASFSGDGSALTGVPAAFTGGTVANQTTFLSSITVNQGVLASTGTFTSTVAVQGNQFSVGNASFTVVGGSATVAYSMTAASFIGNGSGLTGLPAGSEGNTYTSSKTFTNEVLIASPSRIRASSGTFTYSVNASSFNITGASVTTVYGTGRVKTTADQIFYTSKTATSITNMSFALAANTSYYFEYNLNHTSTATATGVWFGLSVPASSTATWTIIQPITDIAASIFSVRMSSPFTSVAGATVGAINSAYQAKMYGNISTLGAGTLQPQVKSELQNGRGSIKAGSSGILREE